MTVNIADNDGAPGLNVIKTAMDVNGAPLYAGDEIEYEVTLSVQGTALNPAPELTSVPALESALAATGGGR